jgi:hypothetical protein
MEVIRVFMDETPSETGLIIAGRAYFFDGEYERNKALATASFVELSLDDFTEEQVNRYLENYNYDGKVPKWLPSRPLLLGTLVARDLLDGVTQSRDSAQQEIIDPSVGWDILLEQISRREAGIDPNIDGETVRRVFERLATKARHAVEGLGPLEIEQLQNAFKEVCGYSADEQGMLLLQRLPGLGIDQEGEGTRKFIDQDLADACRAGDVALFIKNPYGFGLESHFVDIECPIQGVGIRVVSRRLGRETEAIGTFMPALRRAAEIPGTSVLLSDLIRVASDKGWGVETPVYIRGPVIPSIELTSDMADLSRVQFQECYFSLLEIDQEVPEERLPVFYDCYFAAVDGRVSQAGLPEKFFRECVFDRFAQTTRTNQKILELDLPMGTRVMLTVLRKLFKQRGGGRKENALYRGLDHRARRLVPDVLRLLRTEGIVSSYPTGSDTIWVPNRSHSARVGRIISAPIAMAREDILMIESKNID